MGRRAAADRTAPELTVRDAAPAISRDLTRHVKSRDCCDVRADLDLNRTFNLTGGALRPRGGEAKLTVEFKNSGHEYPGTVCTLITWSQHTGVRPISQGARPAPRTELRETIGRATTRVCVLSSELFQSFKEC